MRLLIASMAALAAVAFAAPSFAQTEEPATAPAPAPVPATKAKPGTTAYCQTLKSSTSRSACMKKLHAQATPKATTTKKKTKKTTTAATQPEVGQLAPPPAASSSAPATAPAQSGTVAVPPLPQKTI
jgi:hypothetical protein